MMILEPTMFREYDIRGRVNARELNADAVRLIGRGFGTMLVRGGIREALLGHDSRESSPALRDAMAGGLTSAGCDVIDIGMVLSPVLYWAQYAMHIRGAVMVTGSHNPPEWNGLKLSTELGTTLLRRQIEKLMELLSQQEFESGAGSVRQEDVKERYLRDSVSRVSIRPGFPVVLDAGNGTAGAYAPDAFRLAGCEVDCLFCDIDPQFPNHFPNPSENANLARLRQRVPEIGAEVGLAFDGDGDRVVAVDGAGKIVYADRIVMLLARQVLSRHPGAKIVMDVKCSQGLVDDVAAHGGVPIMCRTGHSYMKDKMRQERAMLAGERSGHIAFAPDWERPGQIPRLEFHYGVDDAVFAGLRLLEYLSQQPRPMSDILAEADPYMTSPEIQVPCPDTEKYKVVDGLVEEFRREYGEDVNDINGARVKMRGGWGLVRASSNLPALVFVFEAKTHEDLVKIRDAFQAKLTPYGITVPWHGEMDDD
jgi:phosphomannomutase/phosphoglucomutase